MYLHLNVTHEASGGPMIYFYLGHNFYLNPNYNKSTNRSMDFFLKRGAGSGIRTQERSVRGGNT